MPTEPPPPSAQVAVKALCWHTYDHVAHEAGDVYEVPADQVENLRVLNFALPVPAGEPTPKAAPLEAPGPPAVRRR
jgi:hypothetical protein